jgi:hypothetical protein
MSKELGCSLPNYLRSEAKKYLTDWGIKQTQVFFLKIEDDQEFLAYLTAIGLNITDLQTSWSNCQSIFDVPKKLTDAAYEIAQWAAESASDNTVLDVHGNGGNVNRPGSGRTRKKGAHWENRGHPH